ncbi:hypothetical protein [Flavobacterium silvaticum]|uniref:DUF3325 domain-containing protein n=1 Tax=Flavobacterium silvaticum TaxID=1852020 RepID=A0A972FNV7_9FLAO|nr:hypothetical protein [Flavobacterium silvaticum]NMH28690.1 hypothetical protein [Flavobacterium silvaticum]
MITLGAFLVFCGFFSAYATSRKAIPVSHSQPGKWFSHDPKRSKMISLVFFILSLALFICVKGLLSGIFLFTITLMVFGSLIVILTPLRLFSPAVVFVVFALLFLAEFILV